MGEKPAAASSLGSAGFTLLAALAGGAALYVLLVTYWWSADSQSRLAEEQARLGSRQPAGRQAVPEDAAAADVARMRAAYESMAAAFAASGLDLEAVASASAWFHLDAPLPWPRHYSAFLPKPLPHGAVRLLLAPVAAASPALASAAVQAVATVLPLLPPGFRVFANARRNLHVTVFHTSHPADPRPDATAPHGGLRGAEQAPCDRPGPRPEQLAAEQAAAAALLAASPPFALRLERVLLARSGVLLLCWSDPSGQLGRLRARLRAAFPGAPARQNDIAHTSLLRIVNTPTAAAAAADGQLEGSSSSSASTPGSQHTQLPAEALAAIQAACEALTARLAGSLLHVTQLWWVAEEEFSTVEGERQPMQLSPAPS